MNIIFSGFGVVGRNTATLLLKRWRNFHYMGWNFRTVGIIDSGGAAICPEGLNLIDALKAKENYKSVSKMSLYGKPNLTTLDVLEKVNADFLIETTPTNLVNGEPSLSIIYAALKKGINVITTNKGPIALSLHQLTTIASKRRCSLKYSGTVGAGIPILEFARSYLNNEKIQAIRGVLNGTTNYILWKMAQNRLSLDEALKEAQRLGIAEKDANYDINGIDTACKLIIIANSTMGLNVRLDQVKIEGIRHVSLNDVLDADDKHMAVRLVGRIEDDLRVSPEVVKKTDHLYVEGNENSICFTTDIDHYTLIGKGAGGAETANAVIRDLVDILRIEIAGGSNQPLS